MFTPNQINQLKADFEKIERASIDSLPKFRAMFAQMTDGMLKQVAQANIKFLSNLAVNACVRRGIELN